MARVDGQALFLVNRGGELVKVNFPPIDKKDWGGGFNNQGRIFAYDPIAPFQQELLCLEEEIEEE